MRDNIVFELGRGRKLDEEKREEIKQFNKMLADTPVQLRVMEKKEFTYVIISFDDEGK